MRVSVAVILLLSSLVQAQQQYLGDLAMTYGILGGTTVTSTGATIVNGRVGAPGAVSGFGVGAGTATGGVTSGTPDDTTALAQATTAYNELQALAPNEIIAADLGGQTLGPGVYATPAAGGFTAATTLTLTGTSTDVFVIQIPAALTIGAGANILLLGGVQACNVYFVVAGATTIGANAILSGRFIAQAAIGVGNLATADGGLYSLTAAITPADNVIDSESCGVVSTVTSTTAATTTTTDSTTDTADVTTTTTDIITETVDVTTTTTDATTATVDATTTTTDIITDIIDTTTTTTDATTATVDATTTDTDIITDIIDTTTTATDTIINTVDITTTDIDATTATIDATITTTNVITTTIDAATIIIDDIIATVDIITTITVDPLTTTVDLITTIDKTVTIIPKMVTIMGDPETITAGTVTTTAEPVTTTVHPVTTIAESVIATAGTTTTIEPTTTSHATTAAAISQVASDVETANLMAAAVRPISDPGATGAANVSGVSNIAGIHSIENLAYRIRSSITIEVGVTMTTITSTYVSHMTTFYFDAACTCQQSTVVLVTSTSIIVTPCFLSSTTIFPTSRHTSIVTVRQTSNWDEIAAALPSTSLATPTTTSSGAPSKLSTKQYTGAAGVNHAVATQLGAFLLTLASIGALL